MLMKFLHAIIENPRVFEWQQRLCNDYTSVRDHFRDYLDVKGKDVLDIGCSTGFCASTILDLRANRYVGIDIDPRYVKYARQRHPVGRFEHMDARDLEFPDDSFDVIVFVGAIHHMDDAVVRACLGQISRVLRPGGAVLCAEPVFTPGRRLSNFLLRNDRGRFIRDEPGYRRLFSDLEVVHQDYLSFSLHRLCSFVLGRKAVSPGLTRQSA